jgi:hypothetical protein
MRKGMIAVLLVLALPLTAATFTRNGPSTTNNDDSCDIGLYPAATLLLPYFEVSPVPSGRTTVFTITNTGRLPQAVRVTLWTDYGYPVVAFSVYLTGYDVQALDLYEIIFRGRIAPDLGTGTDVSPVGDLSANDNPQLVESTCRGLTVQLPDPFLVLMQQAFMEGTISPAGAFAGCERVGDPHENAVGYVTVDVTTLCSGTLPTDLDYFTAELGYDNVLMGDSIELDSQNGYAQGSPMVHIRAIPEGGNPRTHRPSNFERTFYSRLHPRSRRTIDGRQPLPSTFAARWIQSRGGFDASYKIWREVDTPANAACSAYADNAFMRVAEVVRFDEDENPEVRFAVPPFEPIVEGPTLPATARIGFDRGDVLPPNPHAAPAGWLYFNFDSAEIDGPASQNWVVTSMRIAGTHSVDSDAVALGNGCSVPTPVSNANTRRGPAIGPAPNATP